LRAVVKYDSARPLRVSDHFHRWCFDSLKGPYSLNSLLQREVGQILAQNSFRRSFPGSAPLVFRSPHGWEVRQRTAPNAHDHWEYEHHVDQFLATCGQIGAPSGLSVETDFGRVSIGELLDASRRSFDTSQELCWTLVAYCSYLPNEPQWQNRFGETCSYESIVKDILSLPLDSGSCGGTHKQFAIAYFMNSPSGEQLTTRLRRQCEDYLGRSSKLLEESQLRNGAWGPTWTESQSGTSDWGSTRAVDLVRITGHQLEWVELAPAAVRPTSACVSRALQFLAEAFDRADVSDIQRDYCAYSHAACVLKRALASQGTLLLSGEHLPSREARAPAVLADFPTSREGSRLAAQTP
jgi:hypothetical protein